MKHILITLAIGAGLILGFTTTASCTNLISNGIFEKTGPDGTPSGWEWSATRNTRYDLSMDPGEKRKGTASLRVRIHNDDGQIILKPLEETLGDPNPGSTYVLSLWIRTENLDFNRFNITPAIRFNFRPTRTRPAPVYNIVSDFGRTRGWGEVRIQATAPGDAQEFILDMILTPGTIWLDDISITRMESTNLN